MPLTVVITRDVEDRYRGFAGLGDARAGPRRLRAAADERGRARPHLGGGRGMAHRLRRGSIVMCWAEPASAGGLGLSVLGEPPKDVVAHDSTLLVRRVLSPRQVAGKPP